ncbi:MAG: hypothetical protein IJW24_00815 [Clostridia bacterium]|nr:hypothetical protein [Clostridia bacterium]
MKFKQVKIVGKKHTYIGKNVLFGKNVTIFEGNHIDGDTYIGDNVVLLPNNYIMDSHIGANSKIHSSVIEESYVECKAVIGPFSRIRPGSRIGHSVRIGNFSEIKNSSIGERTKVNHMAYVGDSVIGKDCNIGCGVIFANYNGKTKSRTVVGDKCFVGSNVNLIAPLKIGDGVYICAGTTVVHDAKSGSFVIGRARAEEKENRAKDYLKGI